MLVLSQKVGEAITIGDNVTVRLLSIEGSRVKLGFDAPKEVSIIRDKLAGRIKASGGIFDRSGRDGRS